MKSLKSRIRRLETAKNKSKKMKYVVVKTKPERREQDLAKAKRDHSGDQRVVYLISYIPDPAPLPETLQKARRNQRLT